MVCCPPHPTAVAVRGHHGSGLARATPPPTHPLLHDVVYQTIRVGWWCVWLILRVVVPLPVGGPDEVGRQGTAVRARARLLESARPRRRGELQAAEREERREEREEGGMLTCGPHRHMAATSSKPPAKTT
jgi:hypothetical protein